MSFVGIKSEEQLDLQALHRTRELLVSDRTRLINQGRGFLMERGIRVGTGRHVFQKELTRLTAEDNDDLSRRMLMLLSDMASELDVINDRIAAIDAEIKALAKADADMQRLMEIPGVGPKICQLVSRGHTQLLDPAPSLQGPEECLDLPAQRVPIEQNHNDPVRLGANWHG